MMPGHVLQAEAGGEDLPGGGDAGATDLGGDAGGTPEKSSLAQAAADAAAGAATGAGGGDTSTRPEWCPDTNWDAEAGDVIVPEKYWDKDLGTAKVGELAKGHRELSKRFGNATDRAPADIEGYKFEAVEGDPEGFEIPAEQDKAFREYAIGLGLNNTQYNSIVRNYSEGYRTAAEHAISGYVDQQVVMTNQALLAEHGSKEAVKKVQGQAYRAFMHFASAEEKPLVDQLPDHPALINVLARIGAQLAEDSPPSAGVTDSFETLTERVNGLMRDRSSEYWDDAKAGSAEARRVVARYYEECQKRGVDPLEQRLKKAS